MGGLLSADLRLFEQVKDSLSISNIDMPCAAANIWYSRLNSAPGLKFK